MEQSITGGRVDASSINCFKSRLVRRRNRRMDFFKDKLQVLSAARDDEDDVMKFEWTCQVQPVSCTVSLCVIIRAIWQRGRGQCHGHCSLLFYLKCTKVHHFKRNKSSSWQSRRLKPGFHPNATHATHATQAIAFGWKPGFTAWFNQKYHPGDSDLANSKLALSET